jgi:hypothetical protein
VVHHEPVDQGPICACRAVCNLLLLGDDLGQSVGLPLEVVEEGELRTRDGVDACMEPLFVLPRQCIRRGVELAWLVLNLKAVTK